jgi:translation elongation factor EF-Tu-like GTPase
VPFSVEPRKDDLVQAVEPFRLVIHDCFQNTGRCTVVAGDIESGVVRSADEVEIVHDGLSIRAVVHGVEVGHPGLSTAEPTHFVGLLIQDLPKFTPSPGIRGIADRS